MRQAIVLSIVIAMAVPVVAGAVLASNTWNAALKVQDNVSASSLRGQHAEAAAIGHRYFAEKGESATTVDECMLLTYIANQERLANAKEAGLQTLTTFDQRCRWKSDGKYLYYIAYADGLRRVFNGESPLLLDSVRKQ